MVNEWRVGGQNKQEVCGFLMNLCQSNNALATGEKHCLPHMFARYTPKCIFMLGVITSSDIPSTGGHCQKFRWPVRGWARKYTFGLDLHSTDIFSYIILLGM